ncbi:MAG: hypothetical protein IKA79_06060 [Lentisphaeria bacterium]|nr:hypothetical protein [Lentisphaeria bacterium]
MWQSGNTGKKIIFLRQIVPGGADKSYGIHVAKLAGLPPEVISRAKDILENLENNSVSTSGEPSLVTGSNMIRESARPYSKGNSSRRKNPSGKEKNNGEEPDSWQPSLFDL